jgi:hypothetical protein
MGHTTSLRRWTLGLLAALAALMMTFGVASAAPAARPDKPATRTAALARQLKREQGRLKVQTARLDRAAEHTAKLDALIAKQKAKGRDTTALELAVAAYRSAIGQARGELQAARDTLAAHAGFDANGQATDAGQARATLQEAHGHMQQAHATMRGAVKSLRDAVKAYRKANRDANPPDAPPAP